MRIGIIGGGVVGRATARCYLEHVDDVKVWDILPERATHSKFQILDSELVFICLPETEVEKFFAEFSYLYRELNYVLKSTIPIGTTRRLQKEYNLNIVHSPEFLTERCAVTDVQLPARNIIGTILEHEPSRLCGQKLRNLYEHRFPGVQTLVMTSDESEAVKLMTNAFFSVKIATFNEFRCLADKLGLDWDRVIEGVLSDGRIAHSHTLVPGPDGKRGFGGKCLVKDATMLLDQNESICAMVRAALDRNTIDRERTP